MKHAHLISFRVGQKHGGALVCHLLLILKQRQSRVQTLARERKLIENKKKLIFEFELRINLAL